MRVIGRLLLVLFLIIAVPLGGFVGWLALRDPLAALPRAAEKAVATGALSERRGERRLDHIVLEAPKVGRIGLAISLPEPLPAAKLPIILVLGGLATGERNIGHIPQHGENAV